MLKFTYKKHLTSDAEKVLLVLARKKKIKEEEILPVLKKFHLTDALNTIAKYYQKILQGTDIDELRIFNCSLPNTENYVTSSSLAKLAHLFIISGANDFRHLKLSDKAIPNILFLSNIILSHFENDIPLDQNSLLNHLLIMYTEQIELQKNIKHSLCRNYKFYFEKYGELFEEKVGITINEYYKTCLLILLFLNRNNSQFTIEELKNIVSSDNIAFCSEKTIEIVLNYLSITINEYKQFHILNPSVRIMKLQDKPIIRTSEKGHTIYIVPSSPYFVEKVFCGLFYDIESFFKKRCDFRTQFGKIFEEYVGQILELYSANYKIIPEKEIKYMKNKTDALFADWTAISEDEILIIETKSIKMPLKDIYNTTISEFIRTHIIDAYEQILNKVIDIETHSYFESLRQKEITPIIVFRDVPFLHSSLFLNKLNEMIEEKKKSAGQNSIWELLNTHKIYMFTVDDFELYWANKDVVSIKDLFAYMRENPQKSFCECLKKFSADLCEHRIFNEILPDALK